jgi:hypothetical protein
METSSIRDIFNFSLRKPKGPSIDLPFSSCINE